MKKLHVLAIALLLGLATVFGVLAATRTVGIGATAHAPVSQTAIDARSQKLSATERALHRALKDRPPALPAMPAARRSAQTSQHLVYRRPAPLVVLANGRSHSEHEAESTHGGESDDD
jgi:hypothetical protein